MSFVVGALAGTVGEVQAVFSQFVMQGFARHAQGFGEAAHGAVGAGQFGGDQAFFELFDLLAQASGCGGQHPGRMVLGVIQGQFQAEGETLRGVLQFPYIARPAVAQQ